MPVTVVVIGHNQLVRVPAADIAAANAQAQALPQPLANNVCSPICDLSTRVVVQGNRKLAYDNAPNAKPAELFVLHFGQRTDAERWLASVNPDHLAGKTIYLMDPSAVATAPIAAAPALP